MKRIIILITLCLFLSASAFTVTFAVLGCGIGGGGDTPANATGQIVAYIKNGDFVGARGYMSNDAKQMYNDMDLQSIQKEFKGGVTLLEKDKIEIAGNIAKEPMRVVGNKSINYTFIMSKISGKWYITSITKR
jgi:hypothetical protein